MQLAVYQSERLGLQVAAGEEKHAVHERLESSQEALYSFKASLAAAHNEKQQLQECLQSRQAAEEQLWGRINNMVHEHADFEQTIAGLQGSLKCSEVTACHVVLSLPSSGPFCCGQWLHTCLLACCLKLQPLWVPNHLFPAEKVIKGSKHWPCRAFSVHACCFLFACVFACMSLLHELQMSLFSVHRMCHLTI